MQDQKKKKKNPLPDFCVYLDKKEEGKMKVAFIL